MLGPTLFGDSTNEDVVEEDQNVYRTTGGRLAGLWTINDNWNLLTTGIYQRGDTQGTWETDPFLGDNKVTRFYDEWRDDEWYTLSGTLKGDLGFAELSLTGSYFNRKVDYEWDNTNYAHYRTDAFSPDPVYYPIAYYPTAYLYDTGYNKETTFNFQKQSRWSYEARLTSQGDSKLKWMAGAFYEDVYDWWEYGAQDNNLLATNAWISANAIACDVIQDPDVAACPLAPTNYYYYNKYHNEVKQLAFFGEMTYPLTDSLNVTGGARWFQFDREMFDMYQVPFGLPAFNDPDANGLTSKSKDDDTTFKFALDYHFNPDVMVYALYSEGFRLGGQNSLRAANTGEVPLTYGPDSLSNYEIGIKSQWFDNRLQVNGSAFLMEWDDIQLHYETDEAWWIEGNFNGAKAEQTGIELSTQWFATDRLNFEVSVFLASPEFTEDTLVPGTGEVYIAKGTTMPVSPKEKYWAAVEYTFPDFLPMQGDLWTRFSYSWQGQVWDSLTAIEDFLDGLDPEKEFLIPEWKTGTFQVGFTSDNGWDTALIVRNLFDDAGYSYLSSTWYGENFDDPRFRYIRNLQRPRSISLSFTKKFD